MCMKQVHLKRNFLQKGIPQIVNNRAFQLNTPFLTDHFPSGNKQLDINPYKIHNSVINTDFHVT